MKQKLVTILMAFGLAQTEAQNYLENLDTDVSELDPAKLLEAFKEKQTELIKNDAAFITEIKGAEAGRQLSVIEAKLKKKFGLTSEEIKDKKLDEIIDISHKKSIKLGDATTEQLQIENIRLESEVKKLRDEDIPTIRGEVDTHKKNINIELQLEKLVGGKKLRIANQAAMATLKDALANGFKLELADDGKLELYVKGDGKIKPKSKDGSKLIGLDEFTTEFFKEQKILEESNAGNGGLKLSPDGKPITASAGSEEDKAKLLARFPHLRTAEANKESVSADLKARAELESKNK